MNYEQLQYIKAVSEYQSITVAAEKLFVTQSAISQSITSLEKELGLSLFIRSRKGTLPTEEGRWVIPKLIEVHQKLFDLKLEIKAESQDITGELIVATTAGVLMTFLPETLQQLKLDYPLINFNIIEKETAKVVELVQTNKADLGFIGVLYENIESFHSVQVDFLPITSSYYLIVSKSSPLTHYEQIHLDNIENEPFILYGDYFFQDILKRYTKTWHQKKVLFNSFNSEVIKKSVKAGLGVSIVSKLMLENDPYILNGEIHAIKLIGNPFYLPITYCLIYREDQKQNVLVRKIKSYFNQN